MTTDWIGRHDVLLPINQNYDKIRETNKPSFARWKIKRRYEYGKTQQFTQQSAPARAKRRVLSNYKHDAYTVQSMFKSGCWYPITFENFVIVLIIIIIIIIIIITIFKHDPELLYFYRV